jgi:hypothetical protein
MPGSLRLADAGTKLAGQDGREERLSRVLSAVEAGYDNILVDCAPSTSLLTINALIAADAFIIPLSPSEERPSWVDDRSTNLEGPSPPEDAEGGELPDLGSTGLEQSSGSESAAGKGASDEKAPSEKPLGVELGADGELSEGNESVRAGWRICHIAVDQRTASSETGSGQVLVTLRRDSAQSLFDFGSN